MYYMDEGPSGPYKQIIGQEFAYKALAEGSDFFFKSTANELHIQQQLAEQSGKKLKSEIAEIKEERRKDGENFENKMRVL